MGGKAKGAKAEKMKRAERDARRAVIETALAMSRSGLSPGRSGNVSCRWKTGMLITPTGMAYERHRPARHRLRRRQGRGARQESEEAVERVALPSRRLPRAPGHERGRAHAFAQCHRARVRAQSDPGVPLHGGGGGRQRHPARALRHLRHPGAGALRGEGPVPPQRLPDGEPRPDRHWRDASRRARARAGGRGAGDAVLQGAGAGRAGHPAGRTRWRAC